MSTAGYSDVTQNLKTNDCWLGIQQILQGDMYDPVTCNGSVPAVQSERT